MTEHIVIPSGICRLVDDFLQTQGVRQFFQSPRARGGPEVIVELRPQEASRDFNHAQFLSSNEKAMRDYVSANFTIQFVGSQSDQM